MFEKERQGIIMALLDVKNVRKVYTTRFGGNQVEALKDVNFSVEQVENPPFEKRYRVYDFSSFCRNYGSYFWMHFLCNFSV